MKDSLTLIASIMSPGKTWGSFARKALTMLLAASIGAYAFKQYQGLQKSHWDDLPLHVAIEDGSRKNDAQKYLDALVRTHQGVLKGVWVYSWPDARTLLPVAHSGTHEDPMPIGYFQIKDSDAVGQLVMEQCAEIERLGDKLTACPIMAENDAWGVVIFECQPDADRHENWRSLYAALTHKLSHIIYN